ncbi:hypothetical protein PoB_001913200 [Plakobranchus ocellatus]|uniref:Uncharacterized protein n=1 Tax=Plakobranchus ocellatus TaxID=259542 RepID=A0AAV3ZBJ5_9GAST|nr:hypothetical protein PoB_001913200 [Plakobranchus ocellatus]
MSACDDFFSFLSVSSFLLGLKSSDRLYRTFDGRQADSRVFLAAAMETRLFLTAPNLTIESLWDRVIPACYTGGNL